jgi:hypothetical protein
MSANPYNASYVGVWHFENLSANDSSIYNHQANLTAPANATNMTNADCAFGNCVNSSSVAGASYSFDLFTPADLDGGVTQGRYATVMGWLKPNVGAGFAGIFGRTDATLAACGIFLGIDTGGYAVEAKINASPNVI